MCNGMLDSISNTNGPCTPGTKLPLSLLLALAVVSAGHGLGCVRPYMVQNSWVNLTETNSGSFPVGTILQYSCDPGYVADGASILSCTPLGHWSSPPPRCIHTGFCLPPSKPANGGYTSHPSSHQRFSHGVVIEFFCDEGFILKGEYKYLTCRDGQWDDPMDISCVSQVCLPAYVPENGGYTCHPSPCQRPSHDVVIEYFCDEGFILKGDYKYLTCLDGEWDGPMQISCLQDKDRDQSVPMGMPTLSIVASTASTVTLVLLLVVLFVLLQPKLKSFHRREHGVLGQPVSIMVEGVQVTLPSYEEAVGGGGPSASSLGSESRVQIVLSEGHPVAGPEAGPSRPPPFAQHQHSEMAVVHTLPPSSSSSSSSTSPSSSRWAPETLGAAAAPPPQRKPSTGSEQHSPSLCDSEVDFADDIPLLKEA